MAHDENHGLTHGPPPARRREPTANELPSTVQTTTQAAQLVAPHSLFEASMSQLHHHVLALTRRGFHVQYYMHCPTCSYETFCRAPHVPLLSSATFRNADTTHKGFVVAKTKQPSLFSTCALQFCAANQMARTCNHVLAMKCELQALVNTI